jgi:zinc resistance-associated protein
MSMKKSAKIWMIIAIAAVLGFAATSFAGWGRGWSGYCPGPGYGWSQRGFAGPGYQNDLNDEQIAALNREYQAFFNDTRELRENLYQKDLELRAELAKKDPDIQKAAGLQQEISNLESQLAQKRVEQRIKMQKENPQAFAGRGYGYGYGPRGMGRGFYGRGGGCWY